MGFIETIAQFLQPVGAILGAVGGLAQIFMGFKASVPKIRIPTEIFSKIQTRIEGLTGISEEARRNIQSALEAYRRGELLPQYKIRLDEEFEKKKQEAYNLLAVRGLLNSSIAVDVMAELQRWYLNTYYDLLHGQLRDALALSGLAEADINALLTEAQAYSQTLQAQAQAMTMGQLLNLGRVQTIKGGIMSLSEALSSLGTLGKTLEEKGITAVEPTKIEPIAPKLETMYGITPIAESAITELGKPYYPITGLEERLKIGE